MRCNGCGFNVTVSDAPKSRQCNACGKELIFDSDDFLLRQHGAPGRDVRVGQVQMGRLVEKAIKEHAVAFIEAPVGSGKSDAYGVSAVITASPDSGYNLKGYKGTLPSKVLELDAVGKLKPRIVISTAKKNLQHQIAGKDLPFLIKRHGEEAGEIKVALLKGKSNYACRLKADTTLEKIEREEFMNWLVNNPGEDLSDFPGKRPTYLYDVTAEDCIGKSCQYAQDGQCGYWSARLNAAKASIVVTNHHVVAFDLRFGPCAIIGPYTTLILDEAHQAPASFRAAFSNSVSQGGAQRLLRQIDTAGIGGGMDIALRDSWKAMFGQLQSSEGEIPRDPFGPQGTETLEILGELFKEVASEAENLGWSSKPDWDINKVAFHAGPQDKDKEKDPVAEKERKRHLMAVLALKKNIERTERTLLLAVEPGDNTVLYVATNEKGQKKLTLAPISVGKWVGPKLQMIPSVIVTSATLALGGRFDDAKYQLGLNWESYNDEVGNARAPKQLHELILGSPFDYNRQALLYTPRHIPTPVGQTSPDRLPYISALTNECSRLIKASNGNAFILFTSKQDLTDVYAGLLEEDLTQPLIIQEDDAATTLRTFMATPNSVLLGVKSFWEGVDVQGQKLQLVIITKLPFPPLTDPVLQARSRQLIAEQVAQGVALVTAQSSVFSRLQIPHMLTELRQGAGRLIRARTDKGVLAILDSRMFTGNSKDKPLPTQTSYRGYGKLAADATGFNNHVFDYEVIQRVFAQWNERHAATPKSSAAPGAASSPIGASPSDAR